MWVLDGVEHWHNIIGVMGDTLTRTLVMVHWHSSILQPEMVYTRASVSGQLQRGTRRSRSCVALLELLDRQVGENL